MSLIKDIDYGTPESPLEETVDIEIDGMPATVRASMQIRTQTEQVAPSIHRSKWQQEFDERAKSQGKILETV